ncbi:MAG TPA: amino acid--tRNA ligase-related protein [Candidatus Limnocylindria bacterium]|nr:amino acid--tRNA ligase-related protein [Candidatus Limnocylindria bacterium]
MATLQELRGERLRKLEELKKLGVNPYPANTTRTQTAKEVADKFAELEGQVVTLAGRLINTRKFGKIAFFVLKDASGSVQLFLTLEKMSKEKQKTDQGVHYVLPDVDRTNSELNFGDINLLDPGDFIEATGPVIKTQTGEVSVEVHKLRLLTKSLRPMPTEQDGFTNKEERLRRRYIDTNVNKDVQERFLRRSRFWQATRDFLIREGFVEINTPVLEHTTGGADANPFVTHMNALGEDFYLRISHELPLKRLLGGGYERVFDIGPRFRNENYSDEHLPEHVAFESYAAYQDYAEAMELYERMMKEVAQATWGTLQFKIGEFDVNLDQKWPVVKYADIMREKFNVDVFAPDFAQLKQILKDNNVVLEGEVNVNRALDSVWKLIRKTSAGPFWLIHEPVEISPLAKQDPEDPRVTQRFHPVIGGTEMGNGYSELNDPQDQLRRFLDQQALRDAGDAEAQMLDIDFVEMLEYGMPPAAGWSYSERYFWALEGVTAREGVVFPQLRREVDEVTKSIYPEVYGTKGKKPANQGAVRQQDFSKKIVAVVDKELETWRVVNAVAHMTAIIGNQTKKEQLTSGDTFVGSDSVAIPRNSQYPIIIMRASEKQLHTLHKDIQAKHVPYHIFIKEMQDTTNDAEIVESLKNKPMSDTTFYGVAFLAAHELADQLTKGFQLFK